MASETINFGQIFAVAVVGFLLYRWFSGPSSPSSQSSGRNGGRQVNPEHVEAVAQMYPQLDRRAIIWDLHRNGGSVQATVERLLGGRTLETVCASRFARFPQRPGSQSMTDSKHSLHHLSSPRFPVLQLPLLLPDL
jgi:hypothetical protein